MIALIQPMLALVGWTLIVWVWMYATRIPAMQTARIDAAKIKRKQDLEALPTGVQQIADNYNHLHEQPTLFYAVALASALIMPDDALQAQLAWGYVGVRVAHSLVQNTINFVPLRFTVFAVGSFVLAALFVRAALVAFA